MPDPVEPFRAMVISRRAHALSAEGRSIIHMEFGQPSTGAPAPAIAAAQTILANDPLGYWESAPLKARIARAYAETQGVEIAAARIMLTCGASPALVLALTSGFAPGARVAIARPGYIAYRNVLRTLHMVPVEIACGATERYQLTAAALAALDPAPDGVIIASPANPTGTIIAAQELNAIIALCAERSIRIISDEIYHGIAYGQPTPSILREAPDAFVINSFSKYYSMVGWRLGWLIAPQDLAAAAYARMSNLFLTPPALSQHAALIAMDCTDTLEGHIATYGANRALMLAALPAMGLAQIAPPDGAFYIWADIAHLAGGEDSFAFAAALLEDTGVVTAPGVDFDPVEGHHFLRFSFAVSTPQVAEAIARLTPWFKARQR